MRIVKYFSMIIMLLYLFSACVEGENDMNIKLSPQDKTLAELASQIYSDSQLLSIAQFNGSINELDDKYPIECVRKVKSAYRVSYLGDFCIAVIIFDGSGDKILGKVHSAKLLKSDFAGLAVGQSLDYVRKIDPEGEYIHLYTGRNDTPRISTHYTNDGYLITIEYDTANTILNIGVEII